MNIKVVLPLVSALALSGCFEEDNSESPKPLVLSAAVKATTTCSSGYDMAIQTVAPDYSSSQVAMACIQEGGAVDGYLENDSDFSLSAGDKLYHLGRSLHHTVTQYDFNLLSTANWTYSTNDSQETSSNPYKVLEVSSSKAYILRYDQTAVWIVDPSATDEQDFKIGELDLSDYVASTEATTGTSVEMVDGAIVDGKLFIAMQRLRDGTQGKWGPAYSYTYASKVAVFDITTDSEIDTTPADSTDEKAISLTGNNIQALSVADSQIFAASRGDYDTNYGRLETINSADYSVNTLLEGSSLEGHILDVVAISDTQLYFLVDFSGYNDSQEWVSRQGLYKSSNGRVSTMLDKSLNTSFPAIEKDNDGTLWIASADESNPGVYRVDGTTNEADLFIPTLLNPTKIVFRDK